MMKTGKKKIVSSTLIELIVAMLIANIVFFFSFSIIMNSLSGNKMMKEYKAQILVSNYICKEKINKNFDNEVVELEEMSIYKIIEPDRSVFNLYKMTVQVIDKNGILLSESKCYISNEKD